MKKQILAIDRSKAIRFLLQTVLGKEFNVVTAADGCSSMYWLSRKNRPDLIIADPRQDDMTEWELIQHLSESGLYRHIPILVLSSLDPKETECKSLEFGIPASRVFQKPFDPARLIESIREVLSPTESSSGKSKTPVKDKELASSDARPF